MSCLELIGALGESSRDSGLCNASKTRFARIFGPSMFKNWRSCIMRMRVSRNQLVVFFPKRRLKFGLFIFIHDIFSFKICINLISILKLSH